MRAPTDVSPFTPQKVHDILREKVLKVGPLPRVNDPAIAELTRALTIFWWRALGWADPWPEESEQLNKIKAAIRVLAKILPEQRAAYAAVLAGLERPRSPYMAAIAKRAGVDIAASDAAIAESKEHIAADIAACDALITAARAARERGLPRTLYPMPFPRKPIKRWQDFAKELHAIFLSQLPKARKHEGKHAGYRLIMEVAPIIITGEDAPTFQAVQTAFKKKRLGKGKRAVKRLSRGKRAR